MREESVENIDLMISRVASGFCRQFAVNQNMFKTSSDRQKMMQYSIFISSYQFVFLVLTH